MGGRVNKLDEIKWTQQQWIPLYQGEQCFFGEGNEGPPEAAGCSSGSVEKHQWMNLKSQVT